MGTHAKDHLGNKYPSQKAMLRAHGVTYAAFRQRMDAGFTLEECLTPPRQATDHLGTVYKSKASMCAAYGINEVTYICRRKHGWGLKEALTTPSGKPRPSKRRKARKAKKRAYTAPDGTEYPTFEAMCAAYGKNTATVRDRLKFGHDLETALTTPPGALHQCQDPDGNIFRSMAEMAQAHGIDPSGLARQLRAGMTLEQALSARRSYTDPLGNEHPTKRAMCAYLGLNAHNLATYIKAYGSLDEACAHVWNRKSCGKYEKIKALAFPWFECHIRGERMPVIVHFKAIIDEYHSAGAYENIKQARGRTEK